jgi:phenylacetate-coenzyme A ligase PaaK-like adenylate-forming protein
MGFEETCLEVFRYQATSNPIYRQFLQTLGLDLHKITSSADIPFLPVEFFKSHCVIVEDRPVKEVFSSSGTTGALQSRHYVHDLGLYHTSFRKAFSRFYGAISDYSILALLPSYLEREGSSLILMAEDLISSSAHTQSGFYLHNHSELRDTLIKLEAAGQKTLLLGVTYALLDFADAFPMQLNHTILMETGGMKGNRKEMVREEVHHYLCEKFGQKEIHSEYGMTELLSQAYSKGNGIFHTPPWMKVIIRDTLDPLSAVPSGRTGGINIIDLANYYSCSFISTQDLGKAYADGSFEVLGRFDNSDLRGCNLLIAD